MSLKGEGTVIMKHRRGICLLIGLTLGCIALLGSYFVGRNWDSFTIPLSAVPVNSETAQTETTAPISQLLNINTATFEQLQTQAHREYYRRYRPLNLSAQ